VPLKPRAVLTIWSRVVIVSGFLSCPVVRTCAFVLPSAYPLAAGRMNGHAELAR
jgi:hypothetical protein